MYDERPIFIPMDITEDMVATVTRKILGRSVPGGTDSEALQGWILKFGEDKSKYISDETFIDWLANQNSPWSDYWVFMSGCLIELNK